MKVMSNKERLRMVLNHQKIGLQVNRYVQWQRGLTGNKSKIINVRRKRKYPAGL